MPAKDSIPFGYCHCGCGQLTSVATKTSRERGWIKGQPKRFIKHHALLVNGKSQLDWLKEAIRNHGDSDDCLLWPFACDQEGYGRINFRGADTVAHRVAYKLVYGDWPKPCGLHKCDQPACVNGRNHVIPGTRADNIRDMIEKNRHAIGETGRHVLTEEQVRAIRDEYPYTTGPILAAKYRVSPHAIFMVASGRTWKHVK